MTPIPAIALPSLIAWPRDETPHEGPPWEIWWVSAKLQAGARNFAAHVLFHRLADGTLSVGATITDLILAVDRLDEPGIGVRRQDRDDSAASASPIGAAADS